jgi:hypothetical protein
LKNKKKVEEKFSEKKTHERASEGNGERKLLVNKIFHAWAIIFFGRELLILHIDGDL